MPGLLRARRGLRSRVGRHPRASSTATSGSSRARRCGRRWRTWPTGASCWPAPSRDRGATTGLSYLLVPDATSRASTVRPIQQLTGTASSTRCSSTAPAPPRTWSSARSGEGWRVAMATLGFERGVATLGQQVGFQRELDGIVALARSNGRGRRSASCATSSTRAWIGLRVLRAHTLRTLADGGARPRRGVGREAGLGQLAPRARGAGHGGARGRAASMVRGEPLRPGRGSGCSCSAAPTRSTAVPTRSSAASSPSACSACPGRPARELAASGHAIAAREPPRATSLLAGKVVVVTAAAGTGIGSAVARRCLEEGAQVVISDRHERRLGEAHDGAGAPTTGDRVHVAALRRHRREQVEALIAGAVSRLRADRRAW